MLVYIEKKPVLYITSDYSAKNAGQMTTMIRQIW